MTSKANTTNALIFKSASLFALRIVLNSSDLAALKEAITRKMTEAGSLFKDEAVVLDATRINEAPDWSALLSHLQANHLPVIGVMAEGSILDSARQAGLVPVTLSTPSNAERVPHEPPAAPIPQPKPEKPEAKPVETPQLEPSLVIKRQLRSGQRIYARNSDLIVIGAVGRGAEIIADGNIHVYYACGARPLPVPEVIPKPVFLPLTWMPSCWPLQVFTASLTQILTRTSSSRRLSWNWKMNRSRSLPTMSIINNGLF